MIVYACLRYACVCDCVYVCVCVCAREVTANEVVLSVIELCSSGDALNGVQITVSSCGHVQRGD